MALVHRTLRVAPSDEGHEPRTIEEFFHENCELFR